MVPERHALPQAVALGAARRAALREPENRLARRAGVSAVGAGHGERLERACGDDVGGGARATRRRRGAPVLVEPLPQLPVASMAFRGAGMSMAPWASAAIGSNATTARSGRRRAIAESGRRSREARAQRASTALFKASRSTSTRAPGPRARPGFGRRRRAAPGCVVTRPRPDRRRRRAAPRWPPRARATRARAGRARPARRRGRTWGAWRRGGPRRPRASRGRAA